MKKLFLLPLLFSVLGLGCQSTPPVATVNTTPTELTVYTYSSLADQDYGLLPKIIPQFEQQQQVTVNVVTFPDTGSMLNQLILEKDAPKADVVVGLDNVNYAKVVDTQLFTPYIPKSANKISKDIRFDEQFTMTPFDYGYVGFVYDSEKITFSESISLMDLTKDEYRDKIIIEQPGLSSPGTQLLLWTYKALGAEQAQQFWNVMQNNGTLVAPDWSTAYYTMFLKEEAPIVLSYLTSPAYHIDQEDTDRYKTVPISEGYVRQVEGVGIVKNTDTLELAQSWVDTMLSETAQNAIPTTQWMWPVDNQATLPDAYSKIITPASDQIITVSSGEVSNNFNTWLNNWNTTFKIQ